MKMRNSRVSRVAAAICALLCIGVVPVSAEADDRPAAIPVDVVRLNVPQSVQETAYWCGPASLQMVLKYKGISVSQASLAQQLNTSSVTGTEYADLQRVANRYLFGKDVVGANDPGYHIQALEKTADFNQAMSTFEHRARLDISTSDSVFVAVDVHELYPQFSSANHMVVLTGYAKYSGTDNIAYYYIQDPSYLVQDSVSGGLKAVTKEQLMTAIINNDEFVYIY